MTGLIRKATLLSVCGLLIAGVALASVPNSTTSTKPPGIRLGGTTGPAPFFGSLSAQGTSLTVDSRTQFTVTVRDIGGNLVWGANVVIDFSACQPDIWIQNFQPYPGLTTTCPPGTISALTDANGVATFRIVGGSRAGTAAGALCAVMTVDGVAFGSYTVAAYDLDGVGGITGADLSIAASDFFSRPGPGLPFYGRSDLDFTGTITGADLSLLAADFFSVPAVSSGVQPTPDCP